MSAEFISQLAKQGAKKPLMKPLYSVISSCLVLFLYFAILLYYFGLRTDFSTEIHDRFFQIELFFLVAAILFSAASLSFLRLPDFSQKKWVKFLPILFFIGFSLVIFARCICCPDNNPDHLLCGNFDFACLLGIMIFSIIPTAFLIAVLRRGVMTNFTFSFLMIGIASGGLSYFIERLMHETENTSHLFIWHFCPVFLVIFFSAFFTKIFTKKL